jgi:hypothetical protein
MMQPQPAFGINGLPATRLNETPALKEAEWNATSERVALIFA